MAEYCSPCIPTILSGQKRLRKFWSGQVPKMFPRPVRALPKRVIKPVLAKWLDLWSAANWSFSAGRDLGSLPRIFKGLAGPPRGPWPSDRNSFRGGNMPNDNLKKLYVDELKDLFSAENQLLKALPKMAKAASSDELRAGFEEHRNSQKRSMNKQVKRALRTTETNPKRRTRCRGVSLSCSAVLQVENRRTPRSPKGSEGA